MVQQEFRGYSNYRSGHSAEIQVTADYERRGYQVVEHRWRGAGAEIDLILTRASGLIFVEVKKSRSFERAASSLSRRQQQRICQAALAYVAKSELGQLSEMRFDVALVDGAGGLQILENAFGHD